MAGRAGRDRLLLRRPPAGNERLRLAADRDQHRFFLRLGRSRQLPARQPDRNPDLQASTAASAPTWPPPAGDSSGSSPTTAASSAPPTSATPSANSASATP